MRDQLGIILRECEISLYLCQVDNTGFQTLYKKSALCQFACRRLKQGKTCLQAYTKEALYIFELNQIETLLIEKYETRNCRTSREEKR